MLLRQKSLFIVGLIGFQCMNGVSQESISQNDRYPRFCYEAAHNDKVFQSFRRQIPYREIVETVGDDLGKLFAQEIREQYPYILPYFDKICREDKIGEPLSFFYPGIGAISPTVLRYVRILGDLQREFGDLSKFHITEIGGGFGGQCKIIHDIGGFARYDIVDIPEVAPLITKYLSCFSIKNAVALSYQTLRTPIQCDLVISNYAFSEINRAGQLWYMDMIINRAPRGFIIYNHFPSVNPLPMQEFVSLLCKLGKKVKILNEDPGRMGDIVIWGAQK